MSALDVVLPDPRLVEIDQSDVGASPARTWEAVRHGDLAGTPFVALLFAIRTIPDRLRGRPPAESRLDLNALVSTPERPGFQILAEDPPREIVAGAIGKVWRLAIPFVHVVDATAFAAFREPDFAKVAWALRVSPSDDSKSRITFEVRVDTTDDAAWRKFRRYFRIVGPGSRFIRRAVLASVKRQLQGDGRSGREREGGRRREVNP
jgi:hypothetical protein